MDAIVVIKHEIDRIYKNNNKRIFGRNKKHKITIQEGINIINGERRNNNSHPDKIAAPKSIESDIKLSAWRLGYSLKNKRNIRLE
jgi:hypothetical protein